MNIMSSLLAPIMFAKSDYETTQKKPINKIFMEHNTAEFYLNLTTHQNFLIINGQ